MQADFTSLMNLISTTVQPDSWEDLSGPGSIMPYRTTLSLVIRQTQAIHEEIADLLGQLRRLQDLQVTVECRFITVQDNFFERIGINFNFNLHSNVSNGLPNTFGQPLPPFGNGIDFTAGGNSGTSGTSGGTSGGTGHGWHGRYGHVGWHVGGHVGHLGHVDEHRRGGHRRRGGTIHAGAHARHAQPESLAALWRHRRPVADNTFTNNLNIPFQQGSFGDRRADIRQFQPCRRVAGRVCDPQRHRDVLPHQRRSGRHAQQPVVRPQDHVVQRADRHGHRHGAAPFVTSLTPTVGFGSVGFTPQITVLPEGVTMTVQAVISADRRYVRLTVIPSFTAITDVQTFSFVSGAGSPTSQGARHGAGLGGIGGAAAPSGAAVASAASAASGGTARAARQGGTWGTSGRPEQRQARRRRRAAPRTITIQRPIFEIISVATTVSVPDGGTVLLGGIKRLREGRTMAGVPILNKIPYISRLFKNTGVGRETESLMLMVTPANHHPGRRRRAAGRRPAQPLTLNLIGFGISRRRNPARIPAAFYCRSRSLMTNSASDTLDDSRQRRIAQAEGLQEMHQRQQRVTDDERFGEPEPAQAVGA